MKAKLKVLHFGSPSGLYGAERWILSLMAYLDPATVESRVAVVNDGGYSEIPLCRVAQARGFETVTIEAYGRVNMQAVRSLRRYLLENNIDILHTHFYKTDLIGLLAVRGTPCKVVSTPHGWASKPTLSLWLYENLSKLFFPFMDAVVPLSNGIIRSLRLLPGLQHKLYLIENGVDVSEAANHAVVADEMAALKAAGKKIVGYIGRLETGKDLATLLRAIARARDTSLHAALVGEGDQQEALQALAVELGIEDQVTFYGYREDRLSFLKGFDVFVLPSRSEGIPRCLMESMAAGIPIVASDIPGCRNLIDGKTTGLLFDVADVAGLRQQIAKMLDSAESREGFAKEARRFVEERYSCARMAREYEELYLALVGKGEEG